MTTRLRTGSNSELFILSRELLEARFRKLPFWTRFRLRSIASNSLIIEMVAELAKGIDTLTEFPNFENCSPELRLILNGPAGKKN